MPENMDGDDRLRVFIDDFLTPIAADGQLDQCERLPLAAAYIAYDIQSLLDLNQEYVETVLRTAIRRASKRAVDAPDSFNVLLRWRRLKTRSARMTRAEFEQLQLWLSRQVMATNKAFTGIPAGVQFCPSARDSHEQTLQLFDRLFRESGLAVEQGLPARINSTEALSQGTVTVEFDPTQCHDLLQRVQIARQFPSLGEVADCLDRIIASPAPNGQAFDASRYGWDDQAVVVRELRSDTNLWFIGDLHGDLLALEAALQYITSYPCANPATTVFLGDLFDDGDDGFGVLVRVFQLVCASQGTVVVLAGNHDVALGHTGSSFCSSVSPSDLADWLNTRHTPDVERIGRVAIRFFERTPRALFLPDGLLIAHGGVPHKDLWGTIADHSALNSPQCLSDFVWTRPHDRAPRKIPNRATRGAEFGYEDFREFCKKAADAINQPVTRMIRGHDHVQDRYAIYERYNGNLLTINSLSHRLPRECFSPYERLPCVARWIPGRLPQVHRLAIPAEMIQQLYPEPHRAMS